MHAVGKLLRLSIVGQLALHPDEIRKRSICNGAVHRTLGTSLVPVEALPGARGVPVPVDVDSSDVLGDSPGFAVALALGLRQELINEGLLVTRGALVDGVDDSFAEQLQASLGSPLVFNGLQLVSVLTSLLRSHHEVVEGLEVGVRRSHDEGVVTVINCGGNESGSFGVGSSNGKQVGAWIKSVDAMRIEQIRMLLTHDIRLRTDSHQTVDVFADRHKHLSGHVAALLGTWSLVFNVNTSSTALNEQLGELHHSRQATMSGISIRNDGAQVVHICHLATLLLGGGDAFLALFPVMEQLSQEQLVDLVGDGVLTRVLAVISQLPTSSETYHGVVGKIGRGFIGGRGGGGALPSRDVDGVEVFGHLGEHCGLETAIGETRYFVLRKREVSS